MIVSLRSYHTAMKKVKPGAIALWLSRFMYDIAGRLQGL
jgi:hypothetical protein